MDTKKNITILTDEDKNKLLSKTPYVLPDNPSDKGYSSSQIKIKMYEGYLVLFQWLKRAISELSESVDFTNQEINILKEKVEHIVDDFNESILTPIVNRLDEKDNYLQTQIDEIKTSISKCVTIEEFESTLVEINNNFSTLLSNETKDRQANDVALNTFINNVQSNFNQEILNIKNGITIVQKAVADQNGNIINTTYVKQSDKGVANGVAPLNENGIIPSNYMPAYVDDVLEYNSFSNFPSKGESGKIYVAKDTNLTYRWTGTQYIEISPSLALGETSSTAYAGDKGKKNRDDIDKILNDIFTKILSETIYTTTKELIYNAYSNSNFTYKSIFLAKSEIDGQVFVFTNKDKDKFIILDADGYIQYATIEAPYQLENITIGDRYLEADNEIVKGLTDARMGIVSQYQAQPDNVKVGSSIFIDAKLRESINLYDNTTSSVNESFSSSTYINNFQKVNNGWSFDVYNEKPSNITCWMLLNNISLTSLDLNIGDSFVFSCDTNVSNQTNRSFVIFYFVDSLGNAFSPITMSSIDNKIVLSGVVQQDAVSVNIRLSTNYSETVSVGTTFTFSNIQLQKGVEATSYEPYGSYSKGKVLQYASKNLLNIAGMTQMPVVSSIVGKQNEMVFSDVGDSAPSLTIANNTWAIRNTGTRINAFYGKKFIKNHKYLFLTKFSSWLTARENVSNCLIYNSSSTYINIFNSQTIESGYLSYNQTSKILMFAYQFKEDFNLFKFVYQVPTSQLDIHFVKKTVGAQIDTYDELEAQIIIDLTANGDHNLTPEEAYAKYSPSFDTLANGESVINNTYKSALLKTFANNLYLTKPSGYSLTIYEFSENPPYLNQDIDISDYTLLNATTYTSSSAITLNTLTNSILICISKNNNATISPSDLISWANSSQLEYGNEATEHEDYIAPILIGTFDRQVDGTQKTFSFVVLDTENQNLGFIPDDGYITIDLAENVEDLTKSTFAYFATDLAKEVAVLQSKVQLLEETVANQETRISNLENSIEQLLNRTNTEIE